MNRAKIFKAAHTTTAKLIRKGKATNYRATFSEQLKKAYARAKKTSLAIRAKFACFKDEQIISEVVAAYNKVQNTHKFTMSIVKERNNPTFFENDQYRAKTLAKY